MRASVALLALLAVSCARPSVNIGAACQINSDCADPLVCVLAVCRRQCTTARDCGAGLSCIVTSATMGGGCQLDQEASCTLTSECTTGLICQNSSCTTACNDDRDCASGAHCTMDASHTLGCYDTSTEPCIYASDCPDPMICDRDQTCRLECLSDRDCTTPRTCVGNLCQLPDASSPAADGGT